jgi:magnesium-transporting ATPase (P-type)
MHESEDRISTIDLISPAEEKALHKPLLITPGYKKDAEVDRFRSSLRDEHSIDLEELYGRLETNPKFGLTDQEALKRLEEYGENTLQITRYSVAGMVIALAICWLATIAFGILYLRGHVKYMLVVGITTLIVALLITVSTWNLTSRNRNTTKKIGEYEAILPPQVKVLRNGTQVSLLPNKVVPGDIIYLYAGVKAPADIRLIECYGLKVNYTYLTGDILDLERTVSKCFDEIAILADNLVLCGCDCVAGSAKGVVLRTGEYTVVGKTIAEEAANP